jgi:hypothetical protein
VTVAELEIRIPSLFSSEAAFGDGAHQNSSRIFIQVQNIPQNASKQTSLVSILNLLPKSASLVDEVDAEKVQDQTADDIVGKGALGRHGREIPLVRLSRLDPQRSRQNKLPHRRRKPGQERIERVVPRQHAVRKLQAPNSHQKRQKSVQQLGALRRRRGVVGHHVVRDPVPCLRAAAAGAAAYYACGVGFEGGGCCWC